MKAKLLTIFAAIYLFFTVGNAQAVNIDLSNSFVHITGPTTLMLHYVQFETGAKEETYYWANMEWNPTTNSFEIKAYGPEDLSVVGSWDLNWDWECIGKPGNGTMYLYPDGIFVSGRYSGEYWVVDNKITLDYKTGTIYTGEVSGDTMRGTMVNWFGYEGCWDAARIIDSATMSTVQGSIISQQNGSVEIDSAGNAK